MTVRTKMAPAEVSVKKIDEKQFLTAEESEIARLEEEAKKVWTDVNR